MCQNYHPPRGAKSKRVERGLWEICMLARFHGVSQQPDHPCRVVSGEVEPQDAAVFTSHEGCHLIVN